MELSGYQGGGDFQYNHHGWYVQLKNVVHHNIIERCCFYYPHIRIRLNSLRPQEHYSTVGYVAYLSIHPGKTPSFQPPFNFFFLDQLQTYYQN